MHIYKLSTVICIIIDIVYKAHKNYIVNDNI